jgi:hypothetical protein
MYQPGFAVYIALGVTNTYMSPLDSPNTVSALVAFKAAWQAALVDYAQRRLNGEHTLQSSLYYHLRRTLADDFVVFTEAVVRMPDSSTDGKRKILLDLLICHGTEIIVAIELKYTPRGIPSPDSMRKDVKSLSFLRNRRSNADRVKIAMPRYRSDSSDEITFTVSPVRKLILGVYCQSKLAVFDSKWWLKTRPADGFWSENPILPRNLGIATSRTTPDGFATASYIGGPFDRLTSVATSDA